MAECNTCFSEERLITLMRNVFKEEFEKQQQNLLNLISGNFDITKSEIKNVRNEINDLKKSIEFTENVLEEKVAQVESKCKEEFEKQQQNLLNLISDKFDITKNEIRNVRNESNDLKKSIEFTENVLEEKVGHVESKYNYIEDKMNEIYDYQIDPEYVKQKLIDLEDRSRCNNLRVDGIEEKNGETWDDCEKELQNLFTEKLEITDEIKIERAHRTKKRRNSKTKNQPRTIVVRLQNYKDKVTILRNAKKLKGSNVYINEDFCQETLDYRKELWKEVKRLRNEEDKIAYLQYRSIVVKRKNNKG